MSEWRIEVPSCGRAAILADKTLAWLRREGVADRVRVWVPSAERDEYAATVDGVEVVPVEYRPGTTGPIDDGPYTQGVVRNAILDAASPGDLVLQIDDDLTGLREWAGMKDAVNAELRPVENFAALVEWAWTLAEDAGAFLWGLHPAATYARPKTRTGLCYIGGGLFGTRVRRDPVERVLLDIKQDWERSIRFYERDGRLVRLDGVSWQTRGYAGAGGLDTVRTPERADEAARWIAARWPEFARLEFRVGMDGAPPRGSEGVRVTRKRDADKRRGSRKGQTPTPTALKVVDGTAKPEDLDRELKPPTPSRAPPRPAWLSGEGRKLGPGSRRPCSRRGCSTSWSAPLLAVLCNEYGDYVDAAKLVGQTAILATGHRNVLRKNPALSVQRDAIPSIRLLAVEFGLTPASRAGLSLLDELPVDDEVRKLLSG